MSKPVGVALACVLLGHAPAVAKEVLLPPTNAQVSMQFPDDWHLSTGETGLEASAPDDKAFVYTRVLERSKDNPDKWVKSVLEKLKGQGVRFEGGGKSVAADTHSADRPPTGALAKTSSMPATSATPQTKAEEVGGGKAGEPVDRDKSPEKTASLAPAQKAVRAGSTAAPNPATVVSAAPSDQAAASAVVTDKGPIPAPSVPSAAMSNTSDAKAGDSNAPVAAATIEQGHQVGLPMIAAAEASAQAQSDLRAKVQSAVPTFARGAVEEAAEARPSPSPVPANVLPSTDEKLPLLATTRSLERRAVAYKGTTLKGAPIDVELVTFKISDNRMLFMIQASGPSDDRGITIVKSVKSTESALDVQP